MKGSKQYNIYWLIGYVVDDPTKRLKPFLVVLGALGVLVCLLCLLAAVLGLHVWL